MKKMNGIVGAVGFIALGGVLVFNAASSDAGELGHGALLCHTLDGALGLYYNGQIGNLSTTETMTAICPLVAATDQATTGAMLVHTIDASSSAAISCAAYSTSAYGDSNYWSGWSNSVGQGPTNRRTFSFGPLTDSWGAGNRSIVCKLPPKDTNFPDNDGMSRIGSYSSGG